MSTHNKGEKKISKHMDKRLSHFGVNGYCKVISNVSKITSTLLSHVVWTINSMHDHFHIWQVDGWICIKIWHLVYVICHFLTIAKCYLPCVFYTIKICLSMKDFFNWKLLCMFKHYKGMKRFSKYMDKRLSCF
jgi:hypothetical protein